MSIGKDLWQLEGCLRNFSIEVLASKLRPEWVTEALKLSGRSSRRIRKLPAGLVVWVVIGMGLLRTLSIQNVIARLGAIPGFGSLWRKGGEPESSSIAAARRRLGFGPLRILLQKLAAWLLVAYHEGMTWRGLLLLALDGSTFKVPDTEENRKRFGLPGSNRGSAAFPQLRALFLVSARLHIVIEALFAPYRRGEVPMAMRMLAGIPKGALVLLDRGFNAWRFLLGIRARGGHFLVRAKRNMQGGIVTVLGRGDLLVRLQISRHARAVDPSLPKSVLVREIRACVKGKQFRFFTSLLDSQAYPAKELVQIYHERWEEEMVLDEIKTHQGGATTVNRPLILRSMSSQLVLQEAYGLVLAYNLVRAIMAEAAEQAGVAPLQISFVDSLARIRDGALLMATAPTRSLPRIYADLVQSIGRCILPARRDRTNPRAVCIKMSSYPRKHKVRA